MIDTTSPTDWRKLLEFAAVDLDRSFILSWHFESETLLVDVDLFLEEKAPLLRETQAGGKSMYSTCDYRISFLRRLAAG